jgi:hypothetical protein
LRSIPKRARSKAARTSDRTSERRQGISIADELLTLEQKLLEPDFRRDRTSVSALLADDFVEYGSSGRAWSKAEILDKLSGEPDFHASIESFRATELSAGVVLVTYLVRVELIGGERSASMRSSIWIRQNDCWRMIFHQGTPIQES